MKNVLMLSLLCMIVMIFTSSCDRTEETKFSEIEEESANIYEYFLDEVQIDEETFNERSKELPITVVGAKNEDGKTYTYSNHLFSSTKLHYEFGDRNGYCYKEMDEFAKVVSEYAEENGLIELYERAGDVPESYYRFEREAYERILGRCKDDAAQGSEIESRIVTTLFRNCSGGGIWPFTLTLPFMPPGWNNDVEQFEFVAVGGTITMFDRSFYRTRFFRFTGFGFNRLCLPANAQNRMSSGNTFSL